MWNLLTASFVNTTVPEVRTRSFPRRAPAGARGGAERTAPRRTDSGAAIKGAEAAAAAYAYLTPPRTAQVLFAVAALLLLARIIEPIYGSTEFLRLLVVVATTSSTITFVGAYIFYLTSPDKDGSVL